MNTLQSSRFPLRLAALFLGCLSGADASAQTVQEVLPLGSQTKVWEQLQQDPRAQSPEARPMPGEVADEVYKRYVNSFKYPIPEQFKRQSGSSSGGGSGSGDGSQSR